jgi:Xaa-Pro aminopeptidase
MVKNPHKQRLDRFRSLMAQEALDAFVVAVPENRHYLSGYKADDLLLTESSGYLLISVSGQFLLTDFRYEESAKAEAPGFDCTIYSVGFAQVLPDLFSTLAVRRVGFEKDFLTYGRFQEMAEALRAARPSAEIVPSEDLVHRLRIIKDAEEIRRIKASLALTERVLESVWKNLTPGKKEREVAWEIERSIREGGGEAVSFPPIVASGPNAALPHAEPTDRGIGLGESVILDMGSKLDGYCSDMTRTWVAGEPDAQVKEIYRIVREAQLAAQDAICAGKDSVEVDGVARGIIANAGYGDRFGHGLGHGVGLAVHEKPGLRRHGPTQLEENMVVTIEPGIYLPGIGGVRLENMVRITKNGCDVLNRAYLFYDW